jgi:hypothetical protein
MDLGFFRRAGTRFAGRSAARLDFAMLVASLEAIQSASPAARALRGESGRPAALGPHPMVELILGGPAWREAALAQGGSFNRAVASHARKGA